MVGWLGDDQSDGGQGSEALRDGAGVCTVRPKQWLHHTPRVPSPPKVLCCPRLRQAKAAGAGMAGTVSGTGSGTGTRKSTTNLDPPAEGGTNGTNMNTNAAVAAMHPRTLAR